MTEYHPPMTGLESHFEDEIDPKGRSEYKHREQEVRGEMQPEQKASRENTDDRKAEQAMHLGQ